MIAALIFAAATVPAPDGPLQLLSSLAGHCFAGPAPVKGGIDRHCFESVYGGQHIRDRHVVTVDGREVYAGETIYSAKGPKVIFTYWNSIGGLGTGEAVTAGDQWRFRGTIHATAKSAEQPLSADWRMVLGGYEVSEGAEPPRLFKRAD